MEDILEDELITNGTLTQDEANTRRKNRIPQEKSYSPTKGLHDTSKPSTDTINLGDSIIYIDYTPTLEDSTKAVVPLSENMEDENIQTFECISQEVAPLLENKDDNVMLVHQMVVPTLIEKAKQTSKIGWVSLAKRMMELKIPYLKRTRWIILPFKMWKLLIKETMATGGRSPHIKHGSKAKSRYPLWPLDLAQGFQRTTSPLHRKPHRELRLKIKPQVHHLQTLFTILN